MRLTFLSRALCASLLGSAMIATGLAQADVIRVTYDLDGSKFEIRNTPFGAGDGSFDVGPGNLVIDYTVNGNDLVDGGVKLRSYALLLQFTSGTTGLQITTDLTTTANFTTGQLFAEGGVADGVITWTQSFPYNAQGSNTCVGGFCGFAGFQDGVPQEIDSEDPFTFAPFRFGAGGPQAGAGFEADEVQVPGNDSADTFLLLKGTEVSRVRIDTTQPEIELIGDATVSVPCGGVYEEEGATVSDNFSISSQATIAGDVVDTATPGVYVITYNVVDSAGNPAPEITRTVIVEDNCVIEEGAVDGEGLLEGEGVTEGVVEGVVEGIVEGTVEGTVEGVVEGAGEGIVEGEGVAEGIVEGNIEGSIEGATEGEGVVEGVVEGTVEGITEGEGIAEGLVEGEGIVEGEGTVEGEGIAEGEGLTEGEGIAEGEGTTEGVAEGEGIAEGEGVSEGEGALDGEGDTRDAHSGDTNGDNVMDLSEVLRIIQIYNAGAFRCQNGTEDGFGIGLGDRTCLPHSADFIAQDWIIDLSELLRVIQLYNFRGYRLCLESDDGFCAPI